MTRSKRPTRAARHPARKGVQHPARRSANKHARTTRGAPAVAEGIVSPNRAGFGFARVAGLESGVFLPPGEMTGLVQGDRVSLALHRDSQDRWVGRVTETGKTDLSERGALGGIEASANDP